MQKQVADLLELMYLAMFKEKWGKIMSFDQKSCDQHNHTEIIQQLQQFQFHFSMTKRIKIVDNIFMLLVACSIKYFDHSITIVIADTSTVNVFLECKRWLLERNLQRKRWSKLWHH